MLSYPPPPMPQEAIPNQMIRIRIDNIPPAKNWRHIKGFLTQFIPYEQVLNVRVLPLMPSLTPPFMPLQSCIVLLQQNTDWPSLLMQLNGLQWEYHTLMAIVLPNFIPTDGGAGRLGGVSRPNNSTGSGGNVEIRSRGGGRYENQQDTPVRGMRRSIHSDFEPPDISSLTLNNSVPHHSRRLAQIFNENSFRRQMSQRNMHQLKVSNFPPCLHWDEVVKTTSVAASDSVAKEGGEESKSATAEGSDASEGKKTNSAPGPQPHVLQDEKNEIVPDLTIMTSHPERFGKLKWTILKDFIKLKCPKLLEMENKSHGAVLSNTREFYVGVYEDSSIRVEIILLPEGEPDKIIEGPLSSEQENELKIDKTKRFKVQATLFKAVLGFHSKQLCDLCLEAMHDEEYMLEYKLQVERLPKLNTL
ncbi:HCL161Cp [Eremothecium sinecaudum]|uniref:HCL161Cp n=1 Tax=Eremothecium sinecaudum TaxID=45286 RepID=A0A0X8HRA5_9SACH|nr:HCL161Cp [Eremothecium sinecaudum]AMD19990.1 HCL161Cp [Eremothecium sinecaudum]